jgi:hypothetical protein
MVEDSLSNRINLMQLYKKANPVNKCEMIPEGLKDIGSGMRGMSKTVQTPIV